MLVKVETSETKTGHSLSYDRKQMHAKVLLTGVTFARKLILTNYIPLRKKV